MSQQSERPSIAAFSILQPSSFLEARIQEDSNHELDWLWAAEQVISDNERLYCLARALYINPMSTEAWRAIDTVLKARKSGALVNQFRVIFNGFRATGSHAIKQV